MINKPKVVHLPEAEAFIKGLSEKEANKVQINIRKTEAGLRGEWFRNMPGTEGIFEFRTLLKNKKIRILAFWDTTDKHEPLIITTNGFVKKTKRTPKRHLVKAEAIKKDYFSKLKDYK